MVSASLTEPIETNKEREFRARSYDKALHDVEVFHSGRPHRYLAASVDSLDHGPVRDAVEQVVAAIPEPAFGDDPYSEMPRWRTTWRASSWCEGLPGFALYGPVGTGKTFAMSAMLNAAFPRLVAGYLVDVNAIVAQIKATFGNEDRRDRREPERTEEGVIAKYAGAPLLILDDVGKLRTEFGAQTLFRVVDERYSRNLPIWVTANGSPGELATQFSKFAEFGPATIDRLIEMTGRAWIKVDGPSRRLVSR